MSDWQPIETMPAFKRALVGRYDDLGPDAVVPRFLWRQTEAHWYEWPAGSGAREWSYHDPRRFDWGGPTHWFDIQPPEPPIPASPDAPGEEAAARRDR